MANLVATPKKESKKNYGESLVSEIMGEKTKKRETIYKSVSIERQGSKIILPEGMTNKSAIDWLEKHEEAEKRTINVEHRFKAYPNDGAYALYRSIQDVFGFADARGKEGASGENPPKMVDIKLPDGSHISVPWGRIFFPGLPDDNYVETLYAPETMEFVVRGTIQRRYEPVVQLIFDKTEDYLKNHSIYKGRAIRVNLNFLDDAETPLLDPVFMDLSDIHDDSVLLSDTARMDYAGVIHRITNREKCLKQGIPLKHGVLLAGPYGTGKTLTARWTAKIATEHDWTFIYLEKASQMKNGLRLAALYAPAVIFCEDKI